MVSLIATFVSVKMHIQRHTNRNILSGGHTAEPPLLEGRPLPTPPGQLPAIRASGRPAAAARPVVVVFSVQLYTKCAVLSCFVQF